MASSAKTSDLGFIIISVTIIRFDKLVSVWGDLLALLGVRLLVTPKRTTAGMVNIARSRSITSTPPSTD